MMTYGVQRGRRPGLTCGCPFYEKEAVCQAARSRVCCWFLLLFKAVFRFFFRHLSMIPPSPSWRSASFSVVPFGLVVHPSMAGPTRLTRRPDDGLGNVAAYSSGVGSVAGPNGAAEVRRVDPLDLRNLSRRGLVRLSGRPSLVLPPRGQTPRLP
jgi:hypothetical protein